jgi:hypothetical protein
MFICTLLRGLKLEAVQMDQEEGRNFRVNRQGPRRYRVWMTAMADGGTARLPGYREGFPARSGRLGVGIAPLQRR